MINLRDPETQNLLERIVELEEVVSYRKSLLKTERDIHKSVVANIREVILQQRFAAAFMPQDHAVLARAICDDVEKCLL